MTLVAAAQHPGPMTSVLLAATALTAFKHRPSVGWAAAALPAAYAFTDVYLAVLHMFLDHDNSSRHMFAFVRELADSFQYHHADTTDTITGNHMRDIDFLISTVALALFFWHAVSRFMQKPLPRALYLWALLVMLFGELAIFNHSKMHARTHNVSIPVWNHALQDWGLLPSPTFHRTHHTVFTENFSFLVGGSAFYDSFYHRHPHYAPLEVLFWLIQPHTMVSAISALSLAVTPARKVSLKAD